MAEHEDSSSRVRVSILQPELQPYRIPLFNALNAFEDIELTLWVGRRGDAEPPRRYGDILLDPGLGIRLLQNVFWPGSWRRILWQRGIGNLRAYDCDVLIIPEVVHNAAVWSSWWSARRRGLGLILFGYGARPDALNQTRFGAVRDRLRSLMLASADAVSTYTNAGRVAVADLGIDDRRIFVVENSLDTRYLSSLGVKSSSEGMAGSGPLKLLCVARLNPVKRLDLLIEVGRLLSQKRQVQMIVVGSGPEEEFVREAAAELPWLEVRPQEFDPRVLLEHFLWADLLVIPGRIGLTCVHAFAHGLPVVTGSPRCFEQSPEFDYLDPGRNSIVVDSARAADFAMAIESAVDDRECLDRLRRGALATAATLSIEHEAGVLADAIRWVGATPRSAGPGDRP